MDKIELFGMEFYGYHGCLSEEREKGQPFLVDTLLFLDLSKAGKTDSVGDTADYSRVFGTVRKIVEGEPKNLIEAVAEEIAASVLKEYSSVVRISVTVHKPYAPIPGKFKDVSVTIERER